MKEGKSTKELLERNLRDIFNKMQDATSARDLKDLTQAAQNLIVAQPLVKDMDDKLAQMVTNAVSQLLEETQTTNTNENE